MARNRVPPRWLDCPRKGNLIAGNFFPLKTPLDERYNQKIPEGKRWNLEMVFEILQVYQKKMGLLIDLTNTDRFYDCNHLEARYNCRYLKIRCPGHDEPPQEAQIKLFIEVCHEFILKNPLDIIGVHCTHGFNRTGFLICSYLVEYMDFSIDDAVLFFAHSRPPGIYKTDYLEALFQVHGNPADTPLAPALPDWCLEEEEDRDDGVVMNGAVPFVKRTVEVPPGDNEDAPVPKVARKTSEFAIPSLEGITSILDQIKLAKVRHRLTALCKTKLRGFPGQQPVSLDKTNLNFFSRKPYKVSWKADGTRYMMLISGAEEVYLIDRDVHECDWHSNQENWALFSI